MIYILERPSEYKWNYKTYEYELRNSETIFMAHEGRYIALRKEEDEKKEFRYDLLTGEFERINHYKKGDKITRTKAANITKWFTDCRIVTDSEKFAKLYLYARNLAPSNYRSNVRHIEMFAKNKVQRMEQWLSLGVKFDQIEDMFNQLTGNPTNYHSWRDNYEVFYSPNEFSKELLDYILKEQEHRGHLSYRDVNEWHDHWNDGQYDVFQKVEKLIEDKPQYYPVFMVERDSWRDESEYVNVLRSERKANLRNNILQTIKNYNLDLDAFLDYCLYLNNVESVSIDKLMADYPDYLRRELHLKGGKMSKMNKYPETWLTTTHKQQQEYKNLQRLEQLEETGETEKFDNSIEANRHLEWANGHFFIRMPTGAEDIRDEADQMEHCVATYIPRIESGETIVMFMRDKDNPDQSLVTVEVINGAITQAYAKRDTQPTSACIMWLTKWAIKKGLRITASTM